MPTTLDGLRARVFALKQTLDAKTPQEKSGRVTSAMAQHVNSLLEQIKQEVPSFAAQLPQPITSRSDFGIAGFSDIKHLELEMMLNEVVAVLDLLRADH
jgi:hypothetical protein